MNTLQSKTQTFALPKTHPKRLRLKPKKLQQTEKNIEIPLWAYCNDEFFEVMNKTEFEKNFPFDTKSLLPTSSLKIDDILEANDIYKMRPHLCLPKWHMTITEEALNLKFCYQKELLSQSISTFESTVRYNKNSLQKFSSNGNLNGLIDSQGTCVDIPHSITMIERGKVKIENLEVSNGTKRLLLERYYRGKHHSDLRKLNTTDTVYSSLLYELFSKIYKEKPVIEITEVETTGPNINKYMAKHIFNGEILSTAVGQSKKIAKSNVSLKSLEIFAPSLVDDTCKDTKEGDVEVKELYEQSTAASTQTSRDISNQLETIKPASLEKLVGENTLFTSAKKIDRELDSITKFVKKELIAYNNIPKEAFSYQITPENYGNLAKTWSLPLLSQEKPLYEKPCTSSSADEENAVAQLSTEDSQNMIIISSPESKAESELSEDLSLDLPVPIESLTNDVGIITRLSSIYEVYTAILSFTVDDPEIDISLGNVGKDGNAESIICLNHYIKNRLFTKLCFLHNLLDIKTRHSNFVNYQKVGNLFYVSLHSLELGKNFCHHSESLEDSTEMTRYYFILGAYRKCKTIFNVLKAMKEIFNYNKNRLVKKSLESAEKKNGFNGQVAKKGGKRWLKTKMNERIEPSNSKRPSDFGTGKKVVGNQFKSFGKFAKNLLGKLNNDNDGDDGRDIESIQKKLKVCT